jgi:hypothetical protein
MLHEANNLNLQSEIFSSLRLSFRAHDSSSRINHLAGPRHFLIRSTPTQLTFSRWHFEGSRRRKHHEIERFFSTTAVSRGDNAIVVGAISTHGEEIQLSNKAGEVAYATSPCRWKTLGRELSRWGKVAWTARDQYLQAALAGELKLADPLFKSLPFDISESAMAALVESLEELFPGLEVN